MQLRSTEEDEGGIPLSSDEEVSDADPASQGNDGGRQGEGSAGQSGGGNAGARNSSTAAEGGMKQNEIDRARLSWDIVHGHSLAGLGKLLAPTSRTWHKKKFEVCIEGRCFLGCPIFEKEEGGWGRKRRQRRRKTKSVPKSPQAEQSTADQDEMHFITDSDERIADDEDAGHESTEAESRDEEEDEDEEISPTATRTTRLAPQPIPKVGSSWISEGSDPASLGSTNGDTPLPETLTMFNVVFVLSPPLLEHQAHVKTMYTHVIKKLAAALKDRQKRSDYIWTEMRKIIQIREKARNENAYYGKTLPFILKSSSLAAALAETYESIVASRIAHLTLDSNAQLSLQIPQPFSTPYLPPPGRQRHTDLWLTTFDAFQIEDDTSSQNNDHATGAISPHSALMLLVPPSTLLKEIIMAKHMAPALAKALTVYIQRTTPTKSLQQLSKKLRLSVSDLQLLSLHLIHWRRARPIAPLHPTNTYIVSPLADFRKLSQASHAFSIRFAAFPSLVSLLGRLSAASSKGPEPWATLIPSSDHKVPYMEILEWLVRGGWVTQLRTFAWVQVSSQVKAQVARQIRVEERQRNAAAATVEEDEMEDDDVEELASSSQQLDGEGVTKRRHSSIASSVGAQSILSPRLRPHRAYLNSSPRRRISDSGSGSSAHTVLRIASGRAKHDVSPLRTGRTSSANTHHSRHRLSSSSISVQSRILYTGPGDAEAETPIEPSDFEPSIVTSPHKANVLESRWLEHIGSSLPDRTLREAWPRLLKYFDGKHAIEEITLREGMKRKVLNPMLSQLISELGILRTVRHW